MTDMRNTEEITPGSVSGTRIDDGKEGFPQKDSSLEDPTNSGSDTATDARAENKQKDEVTGVVQNEDGQGGRGDEKSEDEAANANPEHRMEDKDYSVFTQGEKRIIVLSAGICSCFSPISSQIYFPSLDAIATDLRVSYTLVNLTVTSYLVSHFVRSRTKLTY